MIPRLCPPISLNELPLALTANARVEDFESAFAKLANAKHAIAFPYGRTALMCLLEALGISGKEVICPSYTCVVVPHAITYSRNAPVFVDCAKDSFLMDMALASEATNANTGALIATSFFGEPVSLDALNAFSKAHPNVAIIQDCAHSFFCEDKGRPVHKQGVAAIYGLNVSKLITSVFGGMVTTDDDALAAKLRAVRSKHISPATAIKSIKRRMYFVASRLALSRPLFGAINMISKLGLLDYFVRYYEENKIDMPSDYLQGMTGFEAAIGIRQCKIYHDVIAHRRKLTTQYYEGLKDCAHLSLPTQNTGHTYSHYTVRTRSAQNYIDTLAKQGVELGHMLEYFIPDMPAYYAAPHFNRGIAKSYIGNVINLPVHRFVSPDDAARIIEHLRFAGTNAQYFSGHWSDNELPELPPSKLKTAGQFLAPMLQYMTQGKILDVGTGDGVHLVHLQQAAPQLELSGLDISASAVATCQKRVPQANVIQADAQTIPAPNASVDAAFSYGVLAYLPNPWQGLTEMVRVTKPGGLIGVWMYPKQSGLLGNLFSITRAIVTRLPNFVQHRVADLLVPFLKFLPTTSNVHLGNASWAACREVILVNIAPPHLIFPTRDEVAMQFQTLGCRVIAEDASQPITLWAIKAGA